VQREGGRWPTFVQRNIKKCIKAKMANVSVSQLSLHPLLEGIFFGGFFPKHLI